MTFNQQIIDEFIEKEIQEGFPGAVLLVIRDGTILKQTAYGYKLKYDENDTCLEHPQPMTVDTMFDLASLTKMYATNYALMQLIEQGKLNVDDPIHNYLPDYRGFNPDNECQFYDPNRVPSDQYSLDKDATAHIIQTNLGFERSRGVLHLPVYSDIDYMLLGFIIEHISGMPLDRYVQVNIYQPLGLTHTRFNPLINTNYPKSDFAATELQGNSRDGIFRFPNERTTVIQGEVHDEKAFYSLNGVSGHAGLFSNLHDMAILVQIMLNHGTYGNHHFWSKSVQDLFLKPYEPDPSYGLGWRLNSNKFLPWFGLHASTEAYGHTGWTGNCSVIDPMHSLAIVLLTNKRHTPCRQGVFDGERYETGKYGKIMTLVYESLLLS